MSKASFVRDALQVNKTAASMVKALRHQYSAAVIKATVAMFQNAEEAHTNATAEMREVQTAAYALVQGLIFQYHPDWHKREASEAATDYLLSRLDHADLLTPSSCKTKRIYVSPDSPDPFMLSVAPDRVLATNVDGTLYLLDDVEAQTFTERTGQVLKPRYTL